GAADAAAAAPLWAQPRCTRRLPGTSSPARLHGFEELGEAFDRLVRSFLHAGGDHAVAVHHRLEDAVLDQAGPVADCLERRRLQGDVPPPTREPARFADALS